jgi:hypothetical protein
MFWVDAEGQLIVDADGHAIDCDECPCGEVLRECHDISLCSISSITVGINQTLYTDNGRTGGPASVTFGPFAFNPTGGGQCNTVQPNPALVTASYNFSDNDAPANAWFIRARIWCCNADPNTDFSPWSGPVTYCTDNRTKFYLSLDWQFNPGVLLNQGAAIGLTGCGRACPPGGPIATPLYDLNAGPPFFNDPYFSGASLVVP